MGKNSFLSFSWPYSRYSGNTYDYFGLNQVREGGAAFVTDSRVNLITNLIQTNEDLFLNLLGIFSYINIWLDLAASRINSK